MKPIHLVVHLVAALALSACSSAPVKAEPSAAPKATAAKPAAPAQQAAPAPVVAVAAAPAKPKTLKSAMKGMENDWKAIEQAIKSGTLGDGASIAAAAQRCAAVMKLAYDTFEDKEVPDFAKFAREAEAGLKAIGQQAGQGRADAFLELGKTLEAQHCIRCHDAVEKVHG